MPLKLVSRELKPHCQLVEQFRTHSWDWLATNGPNWDVRKSPVPIVRVDRRGRRGSGLFRLSYRWFALTRVRAPNGSIDPIAAKPCRLSLKPLGSGCRVAVGITQHRTADEDRCATHGSSAEKQLVTNSYAWGPARVPFGLGLIAPSVFRPRDRSHARSVR